MWLERRLEGSFDEGLAGASLRRPAAETRHFQNVESQFMFHPHCEGQHGAEVRMLLVKRDKS